MASKKLIVWIVTLVFIDQIIKIIINRHFLESEFEIIPSLFEFKTVFNNKGTYMLNLLNLHIGKGILIALHFIMLCLGIVFYTLVKRAENSTMLFDCTFIFFAAGLVSHLAGDIFWEKGCLDYIYLKPLFIFDLKDLYNCCFMCLTIVFLYKHRTFRDLVELTKHR
jgi:lipoprotein signal peptidase